MTTYMCFDLTELLLLDESDNLNAELTEKKVGKKKRGIRKTQDETFLACLIILHTGCFQKMDSH